MTTEEKIKRYNELNAELGVLLEELLDGTVSQIAQWRVDVLGKAKFTEGQLVKAPTIEGKRTGRITRVGFPACWMSLEDIVFHPKEDMTEVLYAVVFGHGATETTRVIREVALEAV